jgi:hypothetical protein
MQRTGRDSQAGWYPLRGSWEESVLTWNEQVDLSFRRQDQERTTLLTRPADEPVVTSSVPNR